MSEKQLLRFLVIREYEKSSEELTETWSELINISKEEA